MDNSGSTYKGVRPAATQGKFISYGILNQRTYYLGTFDSELQAAQYAAAWRRTHHSTVSDEDMELSKPLPDPIPLSPRSSKRKSRVKENVHTYSVYVYDRGMGNKNNLHIATLKKSEHTLDNAIALQVECQRAWDDGDYEYVNAIRSRYGTF